MAEVTKQFGAPLGGSRRPELTKKLVAYLEELSDWDLASEVVIDGSFVSAKQQPSDVDMAVLLTDRARDFGRLSPYAKSLLSRTYASRHYEVDLKACTSRGLLKEWEDYFRTACDGTRKGVVRVMLV